MTWEGKSIIDKEFVRIHKPGDRPKRCDFFLHTLKINTVGVDNNRLIFMNKLSKAFSAFGVSLCFLGTSFSSANPVSITQDGLELTVTANRKTDSVDKTLASVTIFDQSDIEKEQVSNIQELLQAIAGIQLVNNGGAGKVTSLFMRGTESDHTLVLLDGVRINSVSDGGASLQLIPIEMIERIEIVRGARTSLYGSDAIGGVIQIFTKKGQVGETAKPFVTLKAGSHNTTGVTLGASGGYSKGSYNLSLKQQSTRGFNSCTGDSINFAGCFTEEPDKDGFDNQSIALNTTLLLNKKNSLSVNVLHSKNEIEFDGAAPFAANESDTRKTVYGLSLKSKVSDKSNITVSAGKTIDKNTNKQSGVFFNHYNTSRDSFSLLGDTNLTQTGSLVLGLDYSKDRADKVTNYVAPSRSNRGLFLEYKNSHKKLDFQLGYRHDKNKLYGSKSTGNIGAAYTLNDKLKLIGSYSTAFKAPTFDELYFPGFGVPTLNPEEAKVAEIGLRGKANWGNWSTTIFQNKIDNLIVYKSDFSSAGNIDKAEIKGFEAIVDSSLMGWDINSQFTLLDAIDKSGKGNQGKKLARRPAKSLRVSLNKNYGKYGFGGKLIAEDHRFDNASNSRRISGYATVDLLASYKLSKDVTLNAKIGNIFDKEYETISFYPQDGRNAMISLQYSPK